MINLIKAVDSNNELRIAITDTTQIVQTAHNIHNTSATASAALGRTLTAVALMGAWLKNENDSLTISINGDGIAGRIIAVSNSKGDVKAYMNNPLADLPVKNSKLDVSGIIGHNGTIEVSYDLGMRENYNGQSAIVSGEIAEDLAHYYFTSEQIRTAIALGVLVDTDLNIKSAGGFIIQLMPNASEETIVKLEEALKNIGSISEVILKEKSLEKVLNQLFSEFEIQIVEERKIKYNCDCNRERIESVLLSLGKEEIQSMIDEDDGAEVICHFCNKKYNFNADSLSKLINR
ncbi:MAG: Hsp33 family molecular chaperone HslO [Tissierellia bacterium]|nr:Hsp33 family molecular chaperone HslO [Tissierellia bacterium]